MRGFPDYKDFIQHSKVPFEFLKVLMLLTSFNLSSTKFISLGPRLDMTSEPW